MSRNRPSLSALLACLLALAAQGAAAQSHAQPPEPRTRPDPEVLAARQAEARVQQRAALEVWLRRLVGTYGYEGIFDPGFRPARGDGDCAGVGTGPGVQCVVYVTWPELDGSGILPLAPAMFLYGIDPAVPRIRYLRVSARSLAEEVHGTLSGNMATFRTGCVAAAAMPPCRRIIRIEAKPGSRVIHMWDDTEMLIDAGRGLDWVRRTGTMFTLRRTAREDVGSAPTRR